MTRHLVLVLAFLCSSGCLWVRGPRPYVYDNHHEASALRQERHEMEKAEKRERKEDRKERKEERREGRHGDNHDD